MSMSPFTFAGVDLSPYLIVSDVTRHVAPERRFASSSSMGGFGDVMTPNGFEPLEIEVVAAMKAGSMDDVNTLRRFLASALVTDGPGELFLPGEPDVSYMAYYMGGAELSRASKKPVVKLKFKCPDPRGYGMGRSYEPPGGLGTGAHAFSIDVGGNVETALSVSALLPNPTGTATFKVENVTTGEELELSAMGAAGNVDIEMDMGTGKVTSWFHGGNHVGTVMPSIYGDFFRLRPGRCELRVTPGSALRSVSWRERWI